MFRKSLVILLAVSLPLTATSPASAETRKVPYGDLNLLTPQGQKELSRRVDRAVHAVCDAYGYHPIEEWGSIRKCVKETGQAAQTRVAAAISRAQERYAVREGDGTVLLAAD